MASQAVNHISTHGHKSYAKRISTHIAYALVVYTMLLIFIVSPTLEGNGMAIWPYFALVALVAAVILPCRNIERHWQKLDERGSNLKGHFLVARIKIWVSAIGIPVALMLVLGGISSAA
jgi:hypothetical protein